MIPARVEALLRHVGRKGARAEGSASRSPEKTLALSVLGVLPLDRILSAAVLVMLLHAGRYRAAGRPRWMVA
jgi:hypothetical protein